MARTLKFYLEKRPGTAAQAIRTGNNGDHLSFEDVYFTTSPRSTPKRSAISTDAATIIAATGGKSVPHRKRSSPIGAIRRGSKRSGSATFPDAPPTPTGIRTRLTLPVLQRAWIEKRLLPALSNSTLHIRAEPLDPAQSALYSGLRPAALGLLHLVEKTYRATGSTLL